MNDRPRALLSQVLSQVGFVIFGKFAPGARNTAASLVTVIGFPCALVSKLSTLASLVPLAAMLPAIWWYLHIHVKWKEWNGGPGSDVSDESASGVTETQLTCVLDSSIADADGAGTGRPLVSYAERHEARGAGAGPPICGV